MKCRFCNLFNRPECRTVDSKVVFLQLGIYESSSTLTEYIFLSLPVQQMHLFYTKYAPLSCNTQKKTASRIASVYLEMMWLSEMGPQLKLPTAKRRRLR